MERELPWQALQRLGVPLAGVSCRNASVLLRGGQEGGGGAYQGLLEQTELSSQPKGCLLGFPRELLSLPVAGFSPPWSVSSTSAFGTPFPLLCFRELCCGPHGFPSPGLFCWTRTWPTTAV